jgi:hypothetical protein
MTARKVKLADLWQRKSAKGATYFSGFMGNTQVLLFKQGEKPNPTHRARPSRSGTSCCRSVTRAAGREVVSERLL